LTLATVGTLAWAGCDPSKFDSVLDQAPVVSVSAEGSSTSAAFALPLPPPSAAGSTVAARMLLWRTDDAYLAVANYDQNGKVTVHKAPDNVISSLGGAVYSAALAGNDTILLGMPGAGSTASGAPTGQANTLTLATQADGSVSFTLPSSSLMQGGSHLGIAVATGNVTGGASGDFVLVDDNSLWMLPAGSKAAQLTVGNCQSIKFATTKYAFRPLVVGDLLTGGFDEIAVSGQIIGGPAQVTIMAYDPVAKIVCSSPGHGQVLTLGTAGSFGTSLATGDFDGDGFLDLAVGSPPDTVYVYFGPLDTVTGPSVTIKSATATGFGQRIAAFKPIGQAAAQLLVADPGSTKPHGGGTGQVMLFNITRGVITLASTAAVATFFDSSDDASSGVFGNSLGGLQFNAGICTPGSPAQLLPWASSGPNILTFFTYGQNAIPAVARDPRCFN
jgi:hypothetical protein